MNGMADEDENYSDDEWDIPPDQLEALEQDAVRSTQQPKAQTTHNPVSVYKSATISQTQRGEPLNGPSRNARIRAPVAQLRRLDHQLVPEDSFESAIIDEDGLPLVVEDSRVFAPQKPDEIAQREAWRQNRYGQPNVPPRPAGPSKPAFGAPQSYHRPPVVPTHVPNDQGVGETARKPTTTNSETVHAMDEDLKRERDKLAQDFKKLQNELWTSQGEIKNLRLNQAKDSRGFDRQLDLLKKQMQEEISKHKTTLQSKTEEQGRLATDNNFLKHELDEQLQKVQILQRKLQERPLRDKSNDINTTPRKGFANSLRDGFDDDEVMVMSPTKSPAKSGRRSKTSTPTAQRKRKKGATNDSNVPVLALRMSGGASEEPAEVERTEDKPSTVASIIRKDNTTARHLRFIQMVLDFHPEGGNETAIERLIRFAFPSEPTKTFSSFVLTSTSKLAGPRLPGDLLQMFIDLWTRSLKEKYHKPIKLLLQVVNFILDKDPCIVDGGVITNILPPLQATGDINAMIRFNLKSPTKTWDEPHQKKPVLDPDVDTAACLQLLHTIACLVSDDFNLLSLFWRSMSTEHVLLMLTPSQPISDITIMLQLLSTSILPSTFGNICTPEEQLRMETYITDKIVFLVWEQPKPDHNQIPYTRAAICHLRLSALSLLTRFAQTSSSAHPHTHRPSIATHHGTTFLANHPTAIARLVRSVYDEVDNLYCLYPATHHLHARLINAAINILHHILTSPQSESIDLAGKLNGTVGGAHKFRVVMTRLAFREGVYLDDGVSDETVRKATELLEENVTPDEAVELLEAFGRDVESNV